jgi:hypothetical protein
MNDKIQTIADEIIGYSDGAFHIAWNEAYEDLTPEQQAKVADMVFDVIGNCNGCGWHFTYDSMETHSDGECYCWRCYKDMIDADEESEE